MNILFPRTLAEYLETADRNPDAPLMAGGTDLLVRFRGWSDKPKNLICLEKIAELHSLERTETVLRIGAAVPLTRLLNGAELRGFSVLRQALAVLGSPLIRNMATLGGNICTASPAADSLPALYVLDAEVELVSEQGTRRLPISAFIHGPGQTCLRRGELLSSILVPVPGPDGMHYYEKVGQRRALAISMVGMAALVHFQGKVVANIRLAWGSVGPTIIRCSKAEQVLQGGPLTPERLENAAALVRKAVCPISDIRASADYRRQVAGNLLLRLAAITGIA